MTQQEEDIAMVVTALRAGDLRLAARNVVLQEEGDSGPALSGGITMSGAPEVFTPELMKALEHCQAVLMVRLICNDVRICIAPDAHRSSYLFTEDPFGVGKVFMCPLCKAIREEATQSLPPVENCIQFVNMHPLHNCS